MDAVLWVCIFLPLLLLIIEDTKKKKQRDIIVKINRKKGIKIMSDAIKSFIEKDCIIRTMNETVLGVIESVESNWVTVRNAKNAVEIVNADYIISICEHPRNKNGKKKAIVV